MCSCRCGGLASLTEEDGSGKVEGTEAMDIRFISGVTSRIGEVEVIGEGIGVSSSCKGGEERGEMMDESGGELGMSEEGRRSPIVA